MTKVLIATEKPFAKIAQDGIKEIFDKAGFETWFSEPKESYELISFLQDVNPDAMIIRSDKATKEVIEAGKNLKIIVRAGAGYDNIDLAAATAKGIVAMNTPGQNSNAVAELAAGMMVFMARAQFKGGSGSELKGKKLGLHAYGHVPKMLANIAKGFGMEVYAFDPFVPEANITKDGVKVVKNIEELYSTCHYVSLHIPANDKTKKSINFDLMSKMPKGGTIVNTARKEVMDEGCLKKMLEERPDFKYISDIAPECHADLLKYENRYYSTPKKQGAETSEANINAGLAAANQIVNFIKKGDKTFQVNK
ncbi:MAG TPA: NAD(P)-dependent oxidoreductase [Bacteroidales bacterium]|nr:NAD(P)-dependent oxidoreductase [Bacteroidales bacterium]HPS17353.1 NAD(P)-dependent oxidoreductase [Bacteroidales bacterium]